VVVVRFEYYVVTCLMSLAIPCQETWFAAEKMFEELGEATVREAKAWSPR